MHAHPVRHERRVAMCWEAGWEVVQEWEGDREGWLCLHNDTREEDAADVAAFKLTGDISFAPLTRGPLV